MCQYLKMLTILRDALMLDEKKISVKRRLYTLMYTASFVRHWKHDCVEKKQDTKDFLIYNVLVGTELNLVPLIRLI